MAVLSASKTKSAGSTRLLASRPWSMPCRQRAFSFARKHRLKRNALSTAVRLVQAHLPFARKNGSERDDADDAGLSLKPRVNGPARAWL